MCSSACITRREMKTIIIANASSLPDEEAIRAIYEHIRFGWKPEGVQLKETHSGIEKLYMLEDERGDNIELAGQGTQESRD